MDTRTDIASRNLAALLNADPETPFMAAVELAVKAADDLLDFLAQTAPEDQDNEPQEAAQEPRETAPAAPPGVTPTLRDLGVSGRACAPLERMGVTTLAQLAAQSRDDIKQVRGVATSTLKQFDELLTEHGLSWGMDEWDLSNKEFSDKQAEEEPDAAEDEDDLL